MTKKLKKFYITFFSLVLSTGIVVGVTTPLVLLNQPNNSLFYELKETYINNWLNSNINNLPVSEKVGLWNKYLLDSKEANYNEIVANFSKSNQSLMKDFLWENFSNSLNSDSRFLTAFNDVFNTPNVSATYLAYPNFFSFSNLEEKSFIVSNTEYNIALSTSSSTNYNNFAEFNFKYSDSLGYYLQILGGKMTEIQTLFCLYITYPTSSQSFVYSNNWIFNITDKYFFGLSNWCKNYFNIK